MLLEHSRLQSIRSWQFATRILFIASWKRFWMVLDTFLQLPYYKEAFESVAIAKVIATLKTNKLADNPGSYRPISVPCIPSKHFERLIYNRIKSVIESVLPKEKAGFQTNHCTLNQVSLFTEDTETSFEKKLEAGIVHVDLSASGIIAWL